MGKKSTASWFRALSNASERLRFNRRFVGAARGFQVAISVAGIIVRIRKGLAVIQEVFHGFYRDSEPQAFSEGDLHVGNPDYLASKVE
jgi:hypothetical protein